MQGVYVVENFFYSYERWYHLLLAKRVHLSIHEFVDDSLGGAVNLRSFLHELG